MLKAFNYLFYCVYRVLRQIGNEGVFLDGLAFIATALLVWFNFVTIIYIVEIYTKSDVLDEALIIGIYFIYLILCYFYFFKGNRYRTFLEAGQKVKNGRFKDILVWTYIMLTLVLHFYVGDKRREQGIL